MRTLILIGNFLLFMANAFGQTDTTISTAVGTERDVAFGTDEAISSETNGAIVYSVVEVMPEYPGGMAELRKFFKNELHYPKGAKPGKVFVKFIVSETGTIEKNNIKIVMGDSALLNAEAIRVISLMPKWTPGFQENKPVRVSFTIPIDFHP